MTNGATFPADTPSQFLRPAEPFVTGTPPPTPPTTHFYENSHLDPHNEPSLPVSKTSMRRFVEYVTSIPSVGDAAFDGEEHLRGIVLGDKDLKAQ